MENTTRWALVPVIAVALTALLGCGTGNRLDSLDGSAFEGGYFLPPIQTTSIRLEAELVAGIYQGDGLDLTYPADVSPTSGAAFTLPDQTLVHTNEQIYDYDGNGVIDYIVLTIRSLSAQARACITVESTDNDGNAVRSKPANFNKVGGASFEPPDTTFSPSVIIFLPLDGSAGASPGDRLPIYKFKSDYTGRNLSADIGDGSGAWVFVGNGTVDPGGISISIAVPDFGQYCVVAEEIVHDQGTGSDV